MKNNNPIEIKLNLSIYSQYPYIALFALLSDFVTLSLYE